MNMNRTREIKNIRERLVAERWKKNGYEVLKKGWPDFLCVKGSEVVMVEVKRKQKRRSKKMGLSRHQIRMKEILEKVCRYEVEYVEVTDQILKS